MTRIPLGGQWNGFAGPMAAVSLFTSLEGSNRTPCIIRWPGKVPAGKVSNELVHQVDMFTTLVHGRRRHSPRGPADRRHGHGRRSCSGDAEESGRDVVLCMQGNRLQAGEWYASRTSTCSIKMASSRTSSLRNVPAGLQPGMGPAQGTHDLRLPALLGDSPDRPLRRRAFLKPLAMEPPIKPGTPDPYTPPKPGELIIPHEELQIGPITQFVAALHYTNGRPPDAADLQPRPRNRVTARAIEQHPGRRRQQTRPARRRRSGCACCWRASAGRARATRARKTLGRRLPPAGGDAILNEVILRVDSRHRAGVCDPHRVIAGTLAFGADLGRLRLDHRRGDQPGGLKAVVDGMYGGLLAYSTQHPLHQRRTEAHRPAACPATRPRSRHSSRPRTSERVLASAEPCQPVRASVAAIGADLSAQVLTRAVPPVRGHRRHPAHGRPTTTRSASSMLLVRYRGEKPHNANWPATARQTASPGHGVQTELIFEDSRPGPPQGGRDPEGEGAVGAFQV